MNLVRLIVLAAAVFVVQATASAATWDFATAYPEQDFRTRNAKTFADAVKGASDGGLSMVVFADGALVPEAQIGAALRSNRIPIGLLDLAKTDARPLLGFSSLPFLAATYVDSLRLWNAARPVMQSHFANQGLLVLYALPSLPAALFSVRPAERDSDLEGAPMVVDDEWLGRLAVRVGARPVEFDGNSLASIFADRRAAMLTAPDAAESARVWGFVQHAYDVQASFPLCVVVVNQQAFQALDEASQRALLNAAVRAQNDAWAASIDQRNGAVAALGASGLVVQPPSPALMDGLRRAGNAIVRDWRQEAGADAAVILSNFGWTGE
ncbi:MAG: TRAP transporter substrate-binding protein DctP [Rhodospirillales bacterium]